MLQAFFEKAAVMFLLAQAVPDPPVNPASGPVPLSYRFDLKQQLKYPLHLQQRSQTLSRRSPKLTQEMHARFEAQTVIRVISRDRKTTVLELCFRDFEGESTLDGNKLSQFGTDDMKRVRFRFRVSPTEVVSKPELVDSSEVDGALWSNLKDRAEALGSAVVQCLPVLPPEPVSLGGSWKSEGMLPASLPGLPSMNVPAQRVFTFTAFRDAGGSPEVTIEEQLRVSYEGQIPWGEDSIGSSIEGTGKTVYRFAVHTGQMLSCQANLSLSVGLGGGLGSEAGDTQIKLEESWRLGPE